MGGEDLWQLSLSSCLVTPATVHGPHAECARPRREDVAEISRLDNWAVLREARLEARLALRPYRTLLAVVELAEARSYALHGVRPH